MSFLWSLHRSPRPLERASSSMRFQNVVLVLVPALLLLMPTYLDAFLVEGPSALAFRNFQPTFTSTSTPRRALSQLSATKESSLPRTLSSAAVRRTVKENVGSGSYGTVHLLEMENNNDADDADTSNLYIGKRAWTLQDLQEEQLYPTLTMEQLKDKAQSCQAYFDVEVHCFRKLEPAQHASLPRFLGVYPCSSSSSRSASSSSSSSNQWMVFERIEPCQTLQELLKQENDRRANKNGQDNNNNNSSTNNVYHGLATAMGLDNDSSSSSSSFADCLDVVFTDLLQTLVHVHQQNIVHRDIKPANLLLVNPKTRRTRKSNTALESQESHLVLLDFGSAADLDTSGLLKQNVGLDGNRVAISPVYSAPEVFIDPSRPLEALTFDCFSAALLYCQLLFQLTDERTDAGFHQQLASACWNLDTWLQSELQGKVTPTGLDEALEHLRDRPGLWRLLKEMLAASPKDRISSCDALKQWRQIQSGEVDANSAPDGLFLFDVLESMDTCLIESSRPLHFVASFRRNEPLGLILSERYANDKNDDEALIDFNSRQLWEQATVDALPGEVFVKGIAEGSQAERMGIFTIGDRLQGVGELPLFQGGFERAVAMLQDQPRSSTYVTLHFDRKSALVPDEKGKFPLPALEAPIQAKDQGAWSSRGRRKAQEDTFVLHEVHDTKQRSILLAGVMDGHLGTAASAYVQENLPTIFSGELLRFDNAPAEELLERSWNDICDAYRSQCMDEAMCAADYDPKEGILNAFTGSENAVAGTTACIMGLDMQTSHLAMLNCGDSRGLVLDETGSVHFQTADHTPSTEVERFEEGREAGLDYSQPECRLSTWRVAVGDYNFAVSRSLEGSFATSKGIISTPDVHLVQVKPGLTSFVASDGFWEVIDSEEAARILSRLRHEQDMSAGDAAKTLCSLAIEKGSSDNVSVVVLYL